MRRSSQQELLATLAEFDQSDGASLELVAWELSQEASTIELAWKHIQTTGLVRRVGADPTTGEAMYRLTAGGWAALHEPAPRARTISAGPFTASTRARLSAQTPRVQRTSRSSGSRVPRPVALHPELRALADGVGDAAAQPRWLLALTSIPPRDQRGGGSLGPRRVIALTEDAGGDHRALRQQPQLASGGPVRAGVDRHLLNVDAERILVLPREPGDDLRGTPSSP
jgi:hypothetical protein